MEFSMKRSIFWLLTAVALQGLSACATPGAAPSEKTSAQNAAVSTADLTAYHWQLEQAAYPRSKPVQLTFSDQRLAVQGLCNMLSAGYATDGPKMTVQQAISTQRMCNDPALMKREQEIGSRLEKISSWSIAAATSQQPEHSPVLTLGFKDGDQWVLNGKPTNETKYGSSGETVFLEVGPQRVACSHPLIPNKQCLKVRPVEYNAAGLKGKLGQWQNFYDDIEGYTHEAGIRNILRVKRYTRANPPADASRYAYVLDMTVESERVR
jgi:heat shock protein HslJ